jgi:hypothetical protein
MPFPSPDKAESDWLNSLALDPYLVDPIQLVTRNSGISTVADNNDFNAMFDPLALYPEENTMTEQVSLHRDQKSLIQTSLDEVAVNPAQLEKLDATSDLRISTKKRKTLSESEKVEKAKLR